MSNKQVEDKKTAAPKKADTKKAKEKKPGFFAQHQEKLETGLR